MTLASPFASPMTSPTTLPRRLSTAALVMVAVASMVAWLGIVPAPAQAASTRTLTFDTRLTSAGTQLEELPGGIVYGWNHLVGPTMWGKRTADVDFLGSVDYREGTGPFNGFVTVTRADGTTLAFSVSGWSTTPPSETGTSDARFRGTLTVIGGTGAFEGARGTGTMRGVRRAALGSPVRLVFEVTVQMSR